MHACILGNTAVHTMFHACIMYGGASRALTQSMTDCPLSRRVEPGAISSQGEQGCRLPRVTLHFGRVRIRKFAHPTLHLHNCTAVQSAACTALQYFCTVSSQACIEAPFLDELGPIPFIGPCTHPAPGVPPPFFVLLPCTRGLGPSILCPTRLAAQLLRWTAACWLQFGPIS